LKSKAKKCDIFQPKKTEPFPTGTKTYDPPRGFVQRVRGFWLLLALPSAYSPPAASFIQKLPAMKTKQMSSPKNQDAGKSDQEMPKPAQNGGIDESGNVDRIRNILFGSQMRDYDSRFEKLEERLARDATELRNDLQKRLDALQAFMKGEVESMTNRVKTEKSERLQAVEKIGRELGEAAKSLELKITNLDGQAAKDIGDLRQQLLDQSKALSEEISHKHEQMKAGLDHEAQQIRGAMTGREALAEMLTEVALRLKNEFRVPGAS
jgi:hypothetical protein